MASTITVKLAPLKLPASGIEVSIDGNTCAQVPFGDSVSIDVAAGEHQVGATLKGLVKRKSQGITVIAPNNGSVKVAAKYSRLWGNIKLA